MCHNKIHWCPVSIPVSERIGDPGLDPIGEVTGDISGSLKYCTVAAAPTAQLPFLLRLALFPLLSSPGLFLLFSASSIFIISSSFSASGNRDKKNESLTEF